MSGEGTVGGMVRGQVDGFGPQGGDPSRRVTMDLSTCVNRYGPAPAALEALRSVSGSDILMHPYDAPARMKALYAWAVGVDEDDVLPGRGASEFIWAMGRNVDPATVAIPLPGYTDYLKAFPGRGFTMAGEQVPSLEQLDAAMSVAGLVIVSNPHNPTGALLPRDGILDVARAHPAATVVVDESYINFAPDPASASVIGCHLPNVVVLRSTSKFYGIAAARAGIAWCRDRDRLRGLIGPQENWGLSGIDVRVACAAVHSWDWADQTRAQMHEDNRWLAAALAGLPEFELWPNENVHFQFGWTDRPAALAEWIAESGIGVRPLGAAHGVSPGALRIVAPRVDERSRFADAVTAIRRRFSLTGAST
ncbi:MAG: aminotransferase class I/II-fold pyridoxal phosphate-dependent enzyme [Acidimicrobiales bacterium]